MDSWRVGGEVEGERIAFPASGAHGPSGPWNPPGRAISCVSAIASRTEVADQADPEATAAHSPLPAVRARLVRHAPEEDPVTVVQLPDNETSADVAPASSLDVTAALSGQAAGRPGTAGGPKIQAASRARREASIKSDSLRGFELQSYSPDGATRWSAGEIQALQSAGDGSIHLQGSLREILDGIKD